MDSIERQLQKVKTTLLNRNLFPPSIKSSWYDAIGQVRIKPFNRNNVLYYYMPLQGLISYSALSINVMNPSFFVRLFPKKDITNILLLGSFSGIALWLWHRPHVQGTAPGRRFPWVFLGSSMFVLGSVLLWAIVRSALGRRPITSCFLGLATGTALTYSGVDYFYYLDKDIGFVEDMTEETLPSDEDKYDIDI